MMEFNDLISMIKYDDRYNYGEATCGDIHDISLYSVWQSTEDNEVGKNQSQIAKSQCYI